ncbi:unnamed protein product [Orchesella dallaii]|uniref:Uncharacterized protein n=1 Tax=Orchesella dallaii TaxID=48710 RepID=A0ABP1RU53_9HEXA
MGYAILKSHLFILILMTIGRTVSTSDDIGFEAPVYWQKSTVPVVNTEKIHELFFLLDSPCDYITEETFHRELIPEAKRMCEETFQYKVLAPLARFCPAITSHHDDHHREKRALPLMIAGVAAVVSFGVGAWSLERSFSNGFRIDGLEKIKSFQILKH